MLTDTYNTAPIFMNKLFAQVPLFNSAKIPLPEYISRNHIPGLDTPMIK